MNLMVIKNYFLSHETLDYEIENVVYTLLIL